MFDLVTAWIERAGYLGVVALMLAENAFPPLPSELIMPLAGYQAARGELTLAAVIVGGTAGSVLGAIFWYVVGLRLGMGRLQRWSARHGRWMTVSPAELTYTADWFRRHCAKAVLIGRLVPAVRTLISVPAGITRMGFGRFLLYTTIGSALWTSALAGAGYVLQERYSEVSQVLNPVTNVVLLAIAAVYLYRVVRFRPQTRAATERSGGEGSGD